MIEKFRIFIKVTENGSFSQAGKILGLTPSSISRHIDRLESELNVKLFNRSTRHLSLTNTGDNLLEGARKIVADFDAVVASVQPEKNEPEGLLKISVFESYGRLFVCPLIPKFLGLYPKVTIDIAMDNQMVDLYRDDIDLAIRIGNPQDSRLKIRHLVTNRMVVCASPAYLQKRGTPMQPQDLTEHNCLTLNNNRQLHYWYFRSKSGSHKVQINGNIVASGGTPLLEAAKQGLGILLMSEWFVREQINNGELISLMDNWQASLYEKGESYIYTVFIDTKYMKPALRAFIDFITQELGESIQEKRGQDQKNVLDLFL